MDTLKTSFLPNLSMDSSVLTSAATFPAFCPMCGQQFDRAHQAAEHVQLCHANVVAGIGPTGAPGIILASPSTATHPNVEAMKLDFPCYSCEDRFATAQDLDEHHRMVHQTAVFLARCLTCGIYGINAASSTDSNEYKCLQCGSICSAAALAAGQQNFLEQEAPQTPEEMPAIAPKDMNLNNDDQQQQQMVQQQEQQQQQQLNMHRQERGQVQVQQQAQNQPQNQSQVQQEEEKQSLQQQQIQLQQQQQQQRLQHQPQQQSAPQQAQENVELRVPPLTLKLNKNKDTATIANPHVIIKQEPLGDSNGEMPSNSLPVYSIHQPAGSTSSSTNNNQNSSTSSTVVPKARHKCPDCPKTFKTPGTLAMHRKVHTGEAEIIPKDRPYTCSYCGKSFTQSNTLKQHTRIHTGEKPFRCLYCEKCFSVKDYLIKHVRTHTGEKPYSCPYCEKRFTQRSALTVHTTKLHPL